MRQIEAQLAQSKDLIKQMEVEMRSQDGKPITASSCYSYSKYCITVATRKMLTEKVQSCKRTESSLTSDYGRARDQVQKSGLIGGKSENQRQRLLNTNEKSTRGNEMILNSIRTVRETEDVGVEIMTELERNREKIQSSRNKVTDFVGMTDTARRMLAGMENRDTQQKMILGFVAVFLFISIVIIIYYSAAGSTSSS